MLQAIGDVRKGAVALTVRPLDIMLQLFPTAEVGALLAPVLLQCVRSSLSLSLAVCARMHAMR